MSPSSSQAERKVSTGRKFTSLEDECNWILSGREPLASTLQEVPEGEEGEDRDENTLDDISGDEVSLHW